MRTLIAAVLVLAVCTSVASARTWTDSTGKHTVEAEFVDLKDGKVRLKKEDGRTITIPIERLSEADRAYVKSQIKQVSGKPTGDTASELDVLALRKLRPRRGIPRPGGFESTQDFLLLPVAVEWTVAIDRATGVKGDAQDTVRSMREAGAPMRILWNEDGKPNLDVCKRMLARLDSLKPEDVTKWHDAFTKIEGDMLPKYDVALVLLPMDWLFKSDQYDSGAGEQTAATAQSGAQRCRGSLVREPARIQQSKA